MRKAIIVGLTGTTGAGKSIVAEELKKYGYAVIDADAIARLATDKGSPLLDKLVTVYGIEILNEDGSLNRKHLAEIAFSSPEQTRLLNETTHPEIVRLIKKKVQGAFFDGYEAVIIDAPQLFESNLSYDCNFIVSVVAPKEERIKRIMERDSISLEEAEKRISIQKTDEFFKQNSDVYIENDGDLENLKKYVLYTARLIEVKISGEGTLDV